MTAKNDTTSRVGLITYNMSYKNDDFYMSAHDREVFEELQMYEEYERKRQEESESRIKKELRRNNKKRRIPKCTS